MRIWAVANQKGGVGKTTTSVNLAGLLASQENSVLLVDFDPQGSLTSYFGYNPDVIDHSAYHLFQRHSVRVENLILNTGISGLDLLPASSALATLDRQLGAQAGKGLVLANALKEVEARYTHVLIDCPPVLGVLMVNALAACQQLLVPVQTDFLALRGLERMTQTLTMMKRSLNKKLPYTIIPTMFDRRTRASAESLKELQQSYPKELWPSVIPVDTQFRESSRMGVPLTALNPRSRGALAYQELLWTLEDERSEDEAELEEKLA